MKKVDFEGIIMLLSVVCVLPTLAFIALKVAHLVTWGWLGVLSPALLGLVAVLVIRFFERRK